ncbi:PilN domain-containing protein [Candidatus Latescibacterota bacterium]
MTVLIVAAAIGLGGYYFTIQKSFSDVSSELDSLKARENKLKDVVALQAEVNKLGEDITKRLVIIKELTSDSDVRFAMLEHINNVLPNNLWLRSINELIENNMITYNIEGMSYSKDDIRIFLESLEEFDKFSSVSLESITPAPIDIKDAFNYVVKVVLISTVPPKEVPAGTARRRR